MVKLSLVIFQSARKQFCPWCIKYWNNLLSNIVDIEKDDHFKTVVHELRILLRMENDIFNVFLA